MSNDLTVRIRNLIEFVEEYANEEELTTPNGVRATIDIIEYLLNKNEKALEILDIIKKNKGIDLSVLKYYQTVQEWNEEFEDDYFLESNEFDLLKEWDNA